MNPNIEYDNLVKQLLPPHKRQRVRLWLMRTFVMPLRGLFEAFDPWRDDIRMLMNITNQVGRLSAKEIRRTDDTH